MRIRWPMGAGETAMEQVSYRIEVRRAGDEPSVWSSELVAGGSEFDSAAEARSNVRVIKLSGSLNVYDPEAYEYRLVGPNGVESVEMDADAWKWAIDAELRRLGQAGVISCEVDENCYATLSDTDGWSEVDSAEDVCTAIAELVAYRSKEKIRGEVVATMQALQERF